MGVGLQSGLAAVDVYEFWGDRPGSRDALPKHREGVRSICVRIATALRLYFPSVVFSCLSPGVTTRRAIAPPCV